MSLTVSPLHHPRVGGRHTQAVPVSHRILRIAWALTIGATIGAGILAVMAHFAARSDAPSGPSCGRAAVCLTARRQGPLSAGRNHHMTTQVIIGIPHLVRGVKVRIITQDLGTQGFFQTEMIEVTAGAYLMPGPSSVWNSRRLVIEEIPDDDAA